MVTGAGLFAARRAAARPAVRQAKIEAKFGFLKKSYGADVADLVKAILNHVPAAKQNVIANMCVASIKKSLRERSTSTVATDFLIRLLAVRLLFRTVSPDVTKPLSVGEFKRVVSKLHKKAPTTLGRADWNDCGLEFYPSGQKGQSGAPAHSARNLRREDILNRADWNDCLPEPPVSRVDAFRFSSPYEIFRAFDSDACPPELQPSGREDDPSKGLGFRFSPLITEGQFRQLCPEKGPDKK